MRSDRRGRYATLAILTAAVGLLVTSGLNGTLRYYRTPGEVTADPATSRERVRLSGVVAPGSVHHEAGRTVFRLTEDGQEVTVMQHGVPPATFREGEGAVVEGVLGPDGIFHSDQVIVRHGNEYQAPSAPPAAG
ncbi:cytochrome c maturation protein CcmE [Micromonospora polyrhachis]|uniref:Cytochrome c-type biogenesis protein CcmE n=1 Tax=Micromonospora polyrhachis TaxID=1282883 RepID=A0A7W7WST0_9ACTN|nr:cytochrome c maturation protein CcmE [Micromonospora polyrhachis]MBB4962536.1 cytochrome c-type biogenesis protein CcmE [Micromonospora polyrhachis]